MGWSGSLGGFGTQSFERPIVGERIPYMDAGMTAQWMGVTGSHANSVAPLLISTEQGYFKSTFANRYFLLRFSVIIWIRWI